MILQVDHWKLRRRSERSLADEKYDSGELTIWWRVQVSVEVGMLLWKPVAFWRKRFVENLGGVCVIFFVCLCLCHNFAWPETSGKELWKFSASHQAHGPRSLSAAQTVHWTTWAGAGEANHDVRFPRCWGQFSRDHWQPNGNPSQESVSGCFGQGVGGLAIASSATFPTCSKTPRRKWEKPIPISIIATRRCRTGNCQQAWGAVEVGFSNLEVNKFLERVNLKQVQQQVMWWMFGQQV